MEYQKPEAGGTRVKLRVARKRWKRMEDKITVLLVDDHALVAARVPADAGDDETLSVVGEASDGAEGVKLATQFKAGRDCDGLPDAGDEWTGSDAEDSEREYGSGDFDVEHAYGRHIVKQALEAGARGYVLKEALDLDWRGAIKSVAAGQTVLDPKVAKPQALRASGKSGLTQRELEILQHIVAGKSNKENCERIGVEREHSGGASRQHHGATGDS